MIHVWKPERVREGLDTVSVQRCARCGCLSHWPIARSSCAEGVRLLLPVEAAERYRRKAEANRARAAKRRALRERASAAREAAE